MNLTFVDQFYIIKIDGASKVRDKKLTKFSPLLHLKYIKHYFHYSWWKDKHLHNRLGEKSVPGAVQTLPGDDPAPSLLQLMQKIETS